VHDGELTRVIERLERRAEREALERFLPTILGKRFIVFLFRRGEERPRGSLQRRAMRAQRTIAFSAACCR